METLIWLASIAAVVIGGWWVVKLIATFTVKPEFSGLALLKQELRKNGIDVSRIPDAALEEIVANQIKGARALAMAADVTRNRPADRNWRANLVRMIQAEAQVIPRMFLEGPRSHVYDPTAEILVKHGLIKPRLSRDEIIEAAQQGYKAALIGEAMNRRAAAHKDAGPSKGPSQRN